MADEPTAWERAMRAHEAALVVGTRVQVSLGGECPHHGRPEIPISMHRLTNGRTGVVEWRGRGIGGIGAMSSSFQYTHDYWIKFDNPPVEVVMRRPYILYGARFAACELVVLYP